MDSNGLSHHYSDERPHKRQRGLDHQHVDAAIHPDLQATSAAALQDFANGQHGNMVSQSANALHDSNRKRATMAVSNEHASNGTVKLIQPVRELNSECVYREPGQKLDTGDKLILERLDRIESLLMNGQHSRQQANVMHAPPPVDSTGLQSRWQGLELGYPGSGAVVAFLQGQRLLNNDSRHGFLRGFLFEAENDQFPGYSTNPSDVALPNFKKLLRDDFLHDFGLDAMLQYVHTYQTENPHTNDPADPNFLGPNSCLHHLLAGYDEYVSDSSTSTIIAHRRFDAASPLITRATMQVSLVSALNLLVAASYLMFIFKPLAALNLAQVALSQLHNISPTPRSSLPHDNFARSLYFTASVLIADISQALDIQLDVNVTFPGAADLTYNSFKGLSLQLLVAKYKLHSIIRELKQSSDVVTTDPEGLRRQAKVAARCIQQLESWHEMLPDDLQPLMDLISPAAEHRNDIRESYIAARLTISRWFVIAVLMDDGGYGTDAFDHPAIQENIEIWNEARGRQTDYFQMLGNVPSLSRWKTTNYIADETLLVLAAMQKPAMAALLGSSESINREILGIIRQLRPLSEYSPALKAKRTMLMEVARNMGLSPLQDPPQ